MNKMVLSTLVLCLCVVAANAAADAASNTVKRPIISPLVSRVCENATVPAECIHILTAYPGSKNADLIRLTLISIRTATSIAISNAGLLTKMQNGKSIGVEEANCYKNCSDCYSGAVEAFDDSLVALMKGNYALVKEKINIADRYEATCEMCFTATKQENNPMVLYNENARNVGKTALAVADALQPWA